METKDFKAVGGSSNIINDRNVASPALTPHKTPYFLGKIEAVWKAVLGLFMGFLPFLLFLSLMVFFTWWFGAKRAALAYIIVLLIGLAWQWRFILELSKEMSRPMFGGKTWTEVKGKKLRWVWTTKK